MRVSKSWLAVLFLVLLGGCDDPQAPFPEISTMGHPRAPDVQVLRPDGGSSPTDVPDPPPDVIDNSPRIPEQDNAYSCYCKFEIPLSCLDPGCGTITTGTSTTLDGFCDVGVREFHVCFPYGSPLQTFQEAENDCFNRGETTLGASLRASYFYCGEVCNIRYGCTATRLNHTVRTYHEDRCETNCPIIPLDSSLDYEHASYVPAEAQPVCNGEVNYPTPHVCAWR